MGGSGRRSRRRARICLFGSDSGGRSGGGAVDVGVRFASGRWSGVHGRCGRGGEVGGRETLAFTLGGDGIGADTTFYNDAFRRQGFADEASEVQRLWLAGRRDEARDRVPVEMAMKTNLAGDARHGEGAGTGVSRVPG